MPPIYTSDFISDVEDESSSKHKSPPSSVVNSPIKVQNSPVLSKRRKFNVKKSSSSTTNTSSHSTTSSNDSKTSSSIIVVVGEKNSQEFDTNKKSDRLSKEPDRSSKEPDILNKELDRLNVEPDSFNKEPLKPIENLSTIAHSEEKGNSCNLLTISKTPHGRTITEKGKKYRQATLAFPKVVPVIDLSKAEYDENPSNNSKTKINSAFSETLFNNEFNGQSKNENEPKDVQNKQLNKSNEKKKSPKVTSDSAKLKRTSGDQSLSEKDDELIETSPAQNEKSKLRHKLSLNKKSDKGKLKVKTPNVINNEVMSNAKAPRKNHPMQLKRSLSDLKSVGAEETSSIQPNKAKTNSVVKTGKRKLSEPHRTFNDETYFSPAEMAISENYSSDCDTEYENDMKNVTPKVKKMLLASYDM